ncbi:MAG: hypothetical protein Q9211_002627 [Gyalolechia sp. 1 TL-2023]
MPLDLHSPRPAGPFKRSLDDDYFESERPAKRPHLAPTPCHLDELRPPSPQSNAPALPESAKPYARAPITSHPAGGSVEARRICDWLTTGLPPWSSSALPPRPDSAPPKLAGGEDCLDLSDYQRPTAAAFAILHPMSQPQAQSVGQRSAASSRPGTANPRYRSIVFNNGIRIDHTGENIPNPLRRLLDTDILKTLPSSLSPEEIAEAVNTAVEIADDSEAQIYDLTRTALLPIQRREIGRGGNTLWNFDALPRNDDFTYPLATPKPDIHCGYPTGSKSTWSVKENAVINHPAISRYAQPTNGNCYPYYVLELKSEASGGTLWQAENQAAGSGPSCVNSVRQLLAEADPTQTPSTMDSIAFSACVTHRQVVFHVHFYLPEENLHYMSWIASCDTMRDVQRCNHITQNIVQYGLGTRQTIIRNALAKLHPFPLHWKMSRPSTAQASQTADEGAGPNKNQRTQ